MKIGELAKASGSSVETVRYYEREQLLPASARSEANYRVYTDTDVQRLSFIRYCRSLDMTLDEIRVLLRFKDAPTEDCGEVNALLDEHIGHVAARMRELRALEKHLKELRQQCLVAHAAANCGILRSLSRDASSDARPAPRGQAHPHVQGAHASAPRRTVR
jgi:Cd(II)/Pb(II)-responsive transcriptional regulator